MSADKMPPLPGPVIVDRHIPTGVVMYAHTPDQIHAYARAYSAEQTRELVELLQECRSFFENCAVYDGANTNNLDTRCMDAIAKHKGQA